MGFIVLEGLEFYAFHGHFKEEQVVGNKFEVNIIIETNTETPGISDKLEDALDYVSVYSLISHEMKMSSYLLENVIYRIKSKLIDQFPSIMSFELKVTKFNPPVGGKVQKVSVIEKYITK
jgi:dihydroneopterin aldolase